MVPPASAIRRVSLKDCPNRTIRVCNPRRKCPPAKVGCARPKSLQSVRLLCSIGSSMRAIQTASTVAGVSTPPLGAPKPTTVLPTRSARNAKEEYERTQFIGFASDEMFRRKYRYKACKARHQMAQALLTELYSQFSTAADLGSDTLTSISDLGPSVYLENISGGV